MVLFINAQMPTGSRALTRVAGAVVGAIASLAAATLPARALDSIQILVPEPGALEQAELFDANTREQIGAALTVLAEDGSLEIPLSDLRDLAAGGTFTGDAATDAEIRSILNASFGIGERAVNPIIGAVENCPMELVFGTVGQVVYDGSNRGNGAALSAAVKSAVNAAAGSEITVLEVLEQFEPTTLTLDLASAVALVSQVKAELDPLVQNVGDLTVRELTDLDGDRLETLLSESGITESDRRQVEMAIQAFGDLSVNVQLDPALEARYEGLREKVETIADDLIAQIDVGRLVSNAVSGNFSALGNELERLLSQAGNELEALAASESITDEDMAAIEDAIAQAVEPFEAPVSMLMSSMLQIVGVPVTTTGPQCQGLGL